MRARWLLLGGLAVVAAVAAGWMWRRHAAASAPAPKPRVVELFTGSEASVTGRIRAQNVVQVAAPIEGTIEYFEVEPRQPVYEGQLLGRIKNTGIEAEEQAARAELERAQARLEDAQSKVLALRLESSRTQGEASRSQSELESAERAYRRQQMLDREGATPHRVFEKATSEYESAKISRDGLAELARAAGDQYAAAVKNLDRVRQFIADKTRAMDDASQRAAAAEIRSPADGLLIARAKSAGEEVSPDVQDLFVIAVNLSALEAVAEPTLPVLARIRVGQPALLTFADLPEPVAGTVKQAGGGEAVVEFTSPSPVLRPGMTAEIRIKLD